MSPSDLPGAQRQSGAQPANWLLQIDFPSTGPFGEQMAGAYRELADSINDEPGFRWKIWTENSKSGEAGGIYLFDSKNAAPPRGRKHTERLAHWGITDVRAKVFEVNEALSAINQAPLPNRAEEPRRS